MFCWRWMDGSADQEGETKVHTESQLTSVRETAGDHVLGGGVVVAVQAANRAASRIEWGERLRTTPG